VTNATIATHRGKQRIKPITNTNEWST